ncbi:MAG: hypothetical protein H8E34_05520 [Bacteroidetes bacterium]|nr:hypothetical protein [Bacteroidota bacterium]
MSTFKKTEHLPDELILGFIECNLSNTDSDLVNDHLKTCDSCFVKFSTLFASYQEMEEVKLEVTPDMLINKITKKFSLVKSKPYFKPVSAGLQRLVSDVSHWFDNLLRPRKVVYAVVSTGIVVVILLTIFRVRQEDRIESPTPGIFAPFLERQIMPVSSNNLSGIKVAIANDSLKISQPIRFKRELIVQTLNGKILLSKEFMDLNNTFQVPVNVIQDSVIIIITTLDSVVYEAVLRVE